MSEKLKKPYQIATAVYVAAISSFFLLFFDENGLAAISGAKMTCFYTLTLCYIAAILFLFVLHGAQRKLTWAQCRADLRSTPLAAWLILLYLLFTIVSAFLSDYDTVWLGGVRHEGVLTISLYCLSFLLVSRFFRPARWQLYLFAAAASAFCLICILQMLNVNVFGLYPFYGDKTSCDAYIGTFIGTIGNVDFTASFLCVAIPIFWCAILRLKEKQRFLLFLPLLLCLTVLVKISVSAGYLGVFLGALFTLPVVLPCAKKKRIILLIAIVTLLIAALVVIYFVKLPLRDLRQLRNILHGKFKDSYGSGRAYIWRTTLSAVPDHLWFGAGPDTMSLAEFARQDVYAANGVLQYIRSYDAAHNEYLTILYHQGVFALFAYLSALGVTLVQWVRQSEKNAAAAIGGAAVLCYCIQAFFGISQLITSPFFWCVFAVTVSALHCNNTADPRRKN